MAQVYVGEQGTLKRKVAVKVMLPEVARDRDLVKRFRRESILLASLQHENIVTIHDLVEKNGQLFMIMEYVDGIDVHELLKTGPLPLEVALAICDGVVRALEHAHFHRVIHRDIKPSNVMLSTGGHVKLTDFGIAKDLQQDDLTKTGLVVGTPAYLAPEVFKGARADHQSDLYAVGMLLYRCIAGQRPFGKKTGPDLYSAIVNGERTRLRELAPSCPRGVEKMIDKCLEVDPTRRFRNAAELRAELGRHLDKALVSTPAARLVVFLYERGHAHAEHLSTLALDELRLADASLDLSIVVEAPEPGEADSEAVEPETRSGRGRALISIGALAIALTLGVGVLAVVSPETFTALTEWMSRVLE